MRVSYGFIYFFTVGMIAATLLLSVLLIKSIRHFFFSFTRKNKISSNQFLIAAKYIIFAIIFAILIDSVITYKTYSDDLTLESKMVATDNFDLIKHNQRDDYIILYKKYREFYMAERNFMLTGSALFVYYVFVKFLGAFGKLSQVEDDISEAKKHREESEKNQSKTSN